MMFKTKNEIKNWLDSNLTSSYTINDDLTVDVNGVVHLYNDKNYALPIQFNEVKGHFDCSNCNFTTLKGFPKKIKGYLKLENLPIKNLEYVPEYINHSFHLNNCPIETLEYFPKHIGNHFNVNNILIKNLVGINESSVKSSIHIKNCPNLTSLEGSPKKIKDNFFISNCALTSLVHGPETVGANFICNNNKLINLKGSPQKIRGDYYCQYNPLEVIDIETQGIMEFIFSEIQSFSNIKSVNFQIQLTQKYINESNKLPELESLYHYCDDGFYVSFSVHQWKTLKEKISLESILDKPINSNFKRKI